MADEIVYPDFLYTVAKDLEVPLHKWLEELADIVLKWRKLNDSCFESKYGWADFRKYSSAWKDDVIILQNKT